MKFIYNCYGGAHSSVTAAALHVGILPENRSATGRELLSIPYYDSQVSLDHGRIRLVGFDEEGNEVYISSKRNLGFGYERIMRQFLRITGDPKLAQEVVFINTMPYVNIFMVIGGYLSRRMGYNKLGRAIVIYGTRQSYAKFTQLVRQMKEKYHNTNPLTFDEGGLP